MKIVTKVLSVCLLSMLSVAANAALINGSFGVIGGLSATGGTDLATVTAITLTDVFGSGVSADDTSDVTVLSENLVAGSEASLLGLSSVSGFLSIEGWSLELTSLAVIDQRTDLLSLSGTGILTGGTYTPTDATWTFSTTDIGSYNMSVETVAVVPVPAAVWLFGSGLLGLVGVARRKV